MSQNTKKFKTGTHTCPWWFLFTFDNPLRKLIHNPEKMLKAYVQESDTVLDVGCGMGYFTIGLAKLVGQDGEVVAADMQGQMLAGLRKRAERAGLLDRIHLCKSTADQIGLNKPLDFALAFWMVHEVRQPQAFFDQIYLFLKPGGKLLMAEPYVHVSKRAFEQSISIAKSNGFHLLEHPQVRASRAALLCK